MASSSILFTPSQKGDPSPSKKYSPAQAWRGRRIYVGSASAAEELKRLFQETRQNLEVCFNPAILWGRDARVERLDGSHLIPFGVLTDYYPICDRFYAMIPKEEIDLLKRRDCDWGRGFTRKIREDAISFAKEEEIPFQAGMTCIEGGNCRIFVDGSGRPKALVGYHSLLLTILAMEQQGYFERHADEMDRFAASIFEPEEDSYRVAKNLLLCRDKVDRADREKEKYKTPAHKLLHELEPDKKPKYKQTACDFEAKRRMAMELISEELGIPLKDIAFLYQENFHIDLDVLTGPNGIVFLHDEELAIKVLTARREQNRPHEVEVLEGYLKNAHERVNRCRIKFRMNAEAIHRIGCRAIEVAGDFIGARDEERVNFMNGILFNDRRTPRIYTNGTDATGLNLFLKGVFVDAVEYASPQTKVIFVHDQTDRMQRKLGIAVGGLHCLTYLGGISEPAGLPAAEQAQSALVISENVAAPSVQLVFEEAQPSEQADVVSPSPDLLPQPASLAASSLPVVREEPVSEPKKPFDDEIDQLIKELGLEDQ